MQLVLDLLLKTLDKQRAVVRLKENKMSYTPKKYLNKAKLFVCELEKAIEILESKTDS